jgi:hypothetical protein
MQNSPSMKLKTIVLFCAFASLAAPLSVRADEVPAKSSQSEGSAHSGAFPEFQVLTPEEQAKFKAASVAAKKDPKVEAARQRMDAAFQAFRASLETAMIAWDPSMESILKKLQAAREKELGNAAARPAK